MPYSATHSRHSWQNVGFAPTPANGAACATPGVVATTENGASAMAAAAAIPSAFIALIRGPLPSSADSEPSRVNLLDLGQDRGVVKHRLFFLSHALPPNGESGRRRAF